MKLSILPLLCGILLPSIYAQSSSNSATSVCSSPSFAKQHTAKLGSSSTPISIRSLVIGDQICLEFTLDASVSSSAEWFAVGASRGMHMVSSPSANVLFYNKKDNSVDPYVITAESSSGVTKSNEAKAGYSVYKAGKLSDGSLSFTVQRPLKATTSSDVVIKATSSDSNSFIWAYADKWPIVSHAAGTYGTATYSAGAGTALATESPFCSAHNCTALISAVTFVVMLIGGMALTYASSKSAKLKKALRHVTIVSTPSDVRKPSSFATALCDVVRTTLADLEVVQTLLLLIFLVAVLISVLVDIGHEDKQITSGHVALLILTFLILPVTKIQPLWGLVFDSSFERIVKFHRWMGMAIVPASLVHGLLATKVAGFFSTTEIGDATPIYGAIAFICIVVMGLSASGPVRRNFYHIFYFIHRVLSIAIFVLVILHASSYTGSLLAVPLALYAFGILLSWTSWNSKTAEVQVSIHEHSQTTTLVLTPSHETAMLAGKIQPGSFYWLHVPSVHPLEWHPFTAVPTRARDSIGFCVKNMGENTYTKKLLHGSSNKETLNIRLWGPYGRMKWDPKNFGTLVLIAGGVGITPILSILHNGRGNLADAHVLWSVKRPKDLLMADAFLPTASDDLAAEKTVSDNNDLEGQVGQSQVHWTCHASQEIDNGSIGNSHGTVFSYRAGRPVLDELVNAERFGGKKDVLVVACGPETLTLEAQRLAKQHGYYFHKEIFAW